MIEFESMLILKFFMSLVLYIYFFFEFVENFSFFMLCICYCYEDFNKLILKEWILDMR